MLDLRARLDLAGGRRSGGDWSYSLAFAECLATMAEEHRQAEGLPDIGAEPLERIADVFGLSRAEAALLWAVAAPDLDANSGIAYGLLRGILTSGRVTVALALELAGIPTASGDAFALLGSSSRLRRHRLVEVVDASVPWLLAELRCPEPVLATLAGGLPTDPEVDRLRIELAPVAGETTALVADALSADVPLVWVRSASAHSGSAVAAGAFAWLRLHWMAIDLHRHDPSQRLSEVLTAAARNAGLRGWGLVVLGGEAAAESAERGVFDVLTAAATPVVVVSGKAWNANWGAQMPLLVEAEPFTPEDRVELWARELGDEVDDQAGLREQLLGLRLPGEGIVEAARYAREVAAARHTDLGPAEIREAARRVGGAGGGDRFSGLATGRGPTFADLVLPSSTTEELHNIVSWARHRDSLGATGILRGRGRGISALFTGNPGTGKTLAAHVIAEELAIELYQVDLSSIVDKYIGETEKNLERVFQAAEALDVVLFFDEADSLFGKRSDVSDARDRYANQEVAYLLQRMENFDGITVLSTNLRGNLDKAFSRRMSFIVNFPDPDAATRARLWEHHLAQLPALDADDPVDVTLLAETAEVAGGDIRNIVLAAAYHAAAGAVPGTHGAVGQRHVANAAVREYRKLGRMVPDHHFRRG
ncbi:ATP-binding protein [Nocardioides sp. BP30]|uniref:ATP-binding protein n=1 Tax=Nocardioides sp. BP30 TaxID=3036374 RepID=UPI002468C129|nr:ATP-binding protein [Nocardioides sp. BP30]WGL53216.1 ATP-binding protein [Nocardioides sp. BP30]